MKFLRLIIQDDKNCLHEEAIFQPMHFHNNNKELWDYYDINKCIKQLSKDWGNY